MENGLVAFAAGFVFAITKPSLHVNSLGRHLHDDPRLGRPEGKWLPFVNTGELVDMLVSTLEHQLDPTPDGEHVAVRLVAVVHHDRDTGVALKVASLESV